MCDRFNIPRTKRIKHGALIDAKLLADVFIVLNRIKASTAGFNDGCGPVERTSLCKRLPLISVSSSEQQLHQNILNEIDSLTVGDCVW
ncbi:DNA polymerase III subunit epsilon [Candidatus Tremblaya phenacola]|uniref:DNA polymerase III subunit epsilon n=1 Tax=Candidatus Tremblayella phenacoccinincola TaxID=1010676 RepID=A0A2G0V6Z8_9PROT|nr:DNA polymerase III subunit epsilon [Candidatus Tremblaya phenacola]